MAKNRIGTRIETLIRHENWPEARSVIARSLEKEPDDHWLWARLSGVRYEQRDYEGALEAAEKSLGIISDCPLALWSKATATEMLGHADQARELYLHLLKRGLEQLEHPDSDARECWEGPDWTAMLMTDCVFRIAGCFAQMNKRDKAVGMYQTFLNLQDLGQTSIYSREDALAKLKKLVPNPNARRQAAIKALEKMALNPV